MYYTGIDYHKRYSVACTLDAQGRKIREARIKANAPEAFAAYFDALDKPSKVAIEACWNWGVLHDLLKTIGNVAEVILSNQAKNRIICKTAAAVCTRRAKLQMGGRGRAASSTWPRSALAVQRHAQGPLHATACQGKTAQARPCRGHAKAHRTNQQSSRRP